MPIWFYRSIDFIVITVYAICSRDLDTGEFTLDSICGICDYDASYKKREKNRLRRKLVLLKKESA